MSRYFSEIIGSIVGRLKSQGLVGKRKAGESLQQLEQLEARVALDADGQHLAKAALKVIRSSTEAGMPRLVDRTFGKNTPRRSFLRNRASSFFLGLIFGNRLGDRQTGLRMVPAGLERRWSR